MAMLKDPIQTSPQVKVQLLTPTNEIHTFDMRLPIFLNKFTEPIEMPLESFSKFWDDITHTRPTTFQKLDTMIKNPAPP